MDRAFNDVRVLMKQRSTRWHNHRVAYAPTDWSSEQRRAAMLTGLQAAADRKARYAVIAAALQAAQNRGERKALLSEARHAIRAARRARYGLRPAAISWCVFAVIYFAGAFGMSRIGTVRVPAFGLPLLIAAMCMTVAAIPVLVLLPRLGRAQRWGFAVLLGLLAGGVVAVAIGTGGSFGGTIASFLIPAAIGVAAVAGYIARGAAPK